MWNCILRTNQRFFGHFCRLTIVNTLTFSPLIIISKDAVYYLKLQESRNMAHSPLLSRQKKCGHLQRIIIVCIWDSCNGVEEGSCLSFSSGMLTGYTGLLNGCTSCSWWSNREVVHQWKHGCILRIGTSQIYCTGGRWEYQRRGKGWALCSGKRAWLTGIGLGS